MSGETKKRATRFPWSHYDSLSAAMVFDAYIKHSVAVGEGQHSDTRVNFHLCLVSVHNEENPDRPLDKHYFYTDILDENGEVLKSASDKRTRVSQLWNNAKTKVQDDYSFIKDHSLPSDRGDIEAELNEIYESSTFAAFLKLNKKAKK